MQIAVLLKPPRTALDAVGAHQPREPGDTQAATLGPCDKAALDTALQLAEQDEATQITVLAAGPPTAEPTLLEALRRGADAAVSVWSDDLAERIDRDDGLVARLLAAALAQLGADLVLTGTRSADAASGSTGPAVAHALHLPHLTQVGAVERVPQRLRIRATQRRAGGNLSVSLALPAVLTISRGPAPGPRSSKAPSPATVRQITPEALGFDPDDALALGPTAPAQPSTPEGKRLDSAGDLAQRLQALLR